MATNYKNIGVSAATTPTTVCTCNTSQKALVVHSLFIANLDDTNEIRINITVFKSVGGKTTFIAKNNKISGGSTLIIDKPINLLPNDYLSVSATASADVFASYLEVL